MNLASFVRVSRLRLSGFDYFVLTGAVVNMLVIGFLTGYWLFT